MPTDSSPRQNGRGRATQASARSANDARGNISARTGNSRHPKTVINGTPLTPSRAGAPANPTRLSLGRGKRGAIISSDANVNEKDLTKRETNTAPGTAVDTADTTAQTPSQRPLATDISVTGDIIISILDIDGKTRLPFRVESVALKRTSMYFNRLLSNSTFVEGRSVDEIHTQLRERYGNVEAASNEELPHIEVEDVGPISQVKSLLPLLCDFFSILLGKDHTVRKLPLINLANLAIVADRFDCLEEVAKWADAKGHLRPQASPLNEEGHRQRILTGMLLGNNPSVAHHSSQLILGGSRYWSSEAGPPKSDAMWWDLPQDIESELEFRRTAILETLSDLINHHVESYTSRERKCRLGYDTSPLCDSFQLGEFIKFLVKHNALSVQAGLAEDEGHESTTRDLRDILVALRGCPSYQIEHHSHCGPRKQFVAGIEKFESWLQASLIGICFECWRSHLPERSWRDAQPPPIVDAGKLGTPRGTAMLREGHTCSKAVTPDVFLAKERLWAMPTQIASGSLLGS